MKPLPCLCGVVPEVLPKNPKEEGDAWGEVACQNPNCPANPRIRDGDEVADSRGSDAYKALAVLRWNNWILGRMID